MNNLSKLQNAIANTSVNADYIKIIGGLDEITPPYERRSGSASLAINFEAMTQGGYRRIFGYERFSGQPAPSDATYDIVEATITGSLANGDLVVGATSGATGTIIATGLDYFAITKTSGTFAIAESVISLGDAVAVVTAVNVTNGAPTQQLRAQYKALAAQKYRDDIAAVPGSGRVLGVVEYNGVVYAFRNLVSGTGAAMYRSTPTGWASIGLGREISFTSGGTFQITEGATITGATSTATATVKRVILTSGTWAGGTAAGRLILTNQTGTFQSENLDIGANLNVATIAGNSTQISLAPDGNYKFIIENFTGATGTKRLYGCDGKNRGFEFDGSTFVQIITGMTVDTPENLTSYKNHLFFSFGASVQHSATGFPLVWSPVFGASEIALGDVVTGFAVQPGSTAGGALAIFSRNRSYVLYGSSTANWNLVHFRVEMGAYAGTIQDVGFTVFLDDRGITEFQTAQDYGNFTNTTISDRIRTRINALRETATTSCISRDSNQYRVFFSGGEAIYVTFSGRKVVGIMPMAFPNPVICVWHGEAEDGEERIYFGSDNGFVYQMEKGTSFDGDAIEAFFNLAYNFQKSPRINKKYRDCTVEIQSNAFCSFNVGYKIGYGVREVPQAEDQNISANFARARWDEVVWDEFVWDSVTLSPSSIELEGEGENISLAVSSTSDILTPFEITAIIVNYSPRRRLRP